MSDTVQTWLPIDDPERPAPKDGTKFLGWDPLAEAVVVIMWDYGWCMAWDLSPNDDCTYWMPQPEPPPNPHHTRPTPTTGISGE